MKSLPGEPDLHKLLQGESFPQATALQELLQHGSSPRHKVHQVQTPPAWFLHRNNAVSAKKTAPVWVRLLPGSCSFMGSSTGCSFLQGISSSSSMGSSMGSYLLTSGYRESLLWHEVFKGCRRIPAQPSAAPPAPAHSLTTELFLTLPPLMESTLSFLTLCPVSGLSLKHHCIDCRTQLCPGMALELSVSGAQKAFHPAVLEYTAL